MESHECAATHKTCNKCGQSKPVDEFYAKHNKCKPCYKAWSAAYYQANREKRLAQQKKRAEENADKLKAYQAEWYLRNRKRVLENSRKWQEANKGRETKRLADWYTANRDAVLKRRKKRKQDPEVAEFHREILRRNYRKNKARYTAKAAKRRAEKMRATPSWADLDTIRLLYEEARRASKETGVKHNVDHIVPLTSDLVCGLHVEHNLQILTEVENKSKGNTFIVG